MDYLDVMERAEGAIYSVAQTHLSEFDGTVDLYPTDDQPDAPRAHAPARERPPHNPQGGCATHIESRRESHNGGEMTAVIQTDSACYGGRP